MPLGLSPSSVGEPNRLENLSLAPMNQCLKLRQERHLCRRRSRNLTQAPSERHIYRAFIAAYSFDGSGPPLIDKSNNPSIQFGPHDPATPPLQKLNRTLPMKTRLCGNSLYTFNGFK